MYQQFNESKVLIEIEHFIEKIISIKKRPNLFYRDLTELLIEFDEIYNPNFYYSALIGAFIDLLVDMEDYLDCRKSLLKRLSDISFSDIQVDFQKHARRHKRQLSNHRYSEAENTKQLIKRMESVAKKYARILVVRVDIAYVLKQQNSVGIQCFNDDIEELRQEIRDRDGIFKGLIEYAWALEQGEDKGYHCHLLLVYNGSLRRNGYYVADKVGTLWSDITEDKGCHFNCHTSGYLQQFKDLNRVGIGMIHCRNQDEVDNMLNTVKYLVRPEKENQYLRVKCKKRMRTFG